MKKRSIGMNIILKAEMKQLEAITFQLIWIDSTSTQQIQSKYLLFILWVVFPFFTASLAC